MSASASMSAPARCSSASERRERDHRQRVLAGERRQADRDVARAPRRCRRRRRRRRPARSARRPARRRASRRPAAPSAGRGSRRRRARGVELRAAISFAARRTAVGPVRPSCTAPACALCTTPSATPFSATGPPSSAAAFAAAATRRHPPLLDQRDPVGAEQRLDLVRAQPAAAARQRTRQHRRPPRRRRRPNAGAGDGGAARQRAYAAARPSAAPPARARGRSGSCAPCESLTRRPRGAQHGRGAAGVMNTASSGTSERRAPQRLGARLVGGGRDVLDEDRDHGVDAGRRRRRDRPRSRGAAGNRSPATTDRRDRLQRLGLGAGHHVQPRVRARVGADDATARARCTRSPRRCRAGSGCSANTAAASSRSSRPSQRITPARGEQRVDGRVVGGDQRAGVRGGGARAGGGAPRLDRQHRLRPRQRAAPRGRTCAGCRTTPGTARRPGSPGPAPSTAGGRCWRQVGLVAQRHERAQAQAPPRGAVDRRRAERAGLGDEADRPRGDVRAGEGRGHRDVAARC